MTDKTTRAEKTREKQSRRRPWAPPSSLDAPPPPEGYSHRWIRESVMGLDDAKGLHSRLREGFELVRADEYPNKKYSSISTGEYAGIIGVGGLLLARIPNETRAERNAYYRSRTEDQETAVEQDYLRVEHPSMPVHNERKSRVTFGGKRGND